MNKAGAGTKERVRMIRAALNKDFLVAEYVQKRRHSTDIAAELGLDGQTVRNCLRKHGIAIRRPTEANRTYAEPSNVKGFTGPDSDRHAYWLGFIAADGCVFTGDGSGRHSVVRIKLHIQDREHLEAFRAGPRAAPPVRTGVDGPRHFARFEVHSPSLVAALARCGITARKSCSLAFPKINPAFIPAFVRGYFDGDGTIFWRRRKYSLGPVCRFTSGSVGFLRDLNETLTASGIKTLSPHRNGASNAHVLPVSGAAENLRRFAEFLYRGASIYLPRKHALFAPFFMENAA